MRLAAVMVLVAACSGSSSPAAHPRDATAPLANAAPAGADHDDGLAAPAPDGPPAPTAIADVPLGAPCATRGYQAPAGARPELVHRVRGGVLEIGLRNAGTAPVCVYTHVATHELQSDWLTIEYADGDTYHHFHRALHLNDDRDKSAAASRELAPGETFWLGFDLDAWARRPRNGAEPIRRGGDLYVEAIYDTTHEDEVWAGRLERTFGMALP